MGPVRGNRDAAKTVAAPSAAILIPTLDNWSGFEEESIVLPAWVPKASQMQVYIPGLDRAGLTFDKIHPKWLDYGGWPLQRAYLTCGKPEETKKLRQTRHTWSSTISESSDSDTANCCSWHSQSQLNSPCPFQKAKHRLDNVHLPSVRKTEQHLSLIIFRSTCACVYFSKLSLPHNTLPKPRLCRKKLSCPNGYKWHMDHGWSICQFLGKRFHSFHHQLLFCPSSHC